MIQRHHHTFVWTTTLFTLAVVWIASLEGLNAFVISGPRGVSRVEPSSQHLFRKSVHTVSTRWSASADGQQQESVETDSVKSSDATETSETKNKEQSNDEPISLDTDQNEPISADSEQGATPEDTELANLKDEIAQLETTLKNKRRQLAALNDQVDDYSKAGYARKVAEMENMRRARSMLNTSNRSSSMAATLIRFLPILDKLDELRAQADGNSFAQQYKALPVAFRSALTGLGVTEFTVATGDVVDLSRVTVLTEEHNDAPAWTVLRPLKSGLELQGNVIRPAECVASVGPEETAEETEETTASLTEDSEPSDNVESSDNTDSTEKQE